MKPKQLSRATLQRKIRRLQEALRIRDSNISVFDANRLSGIYLTLQGRYPHIITIEDGLNEAALERDRLSSLLQAYKDRETDKAHRIIRSNP